MTNLRDTDRMTPAELPAEDDEPVAHAAEHVAPHAVPRVSAHKTMELDTVKVSDPTLNSRNAPTQRGLRAPVVPPGYNPEADAGYVVDDVPKPPTSKPWLLIGGAGFIVAILGVGLTYALTRGSPPVPSASQEAAAPPAEAPAEVAAPAEPASPAPSNAAEGPAHEAERPEAEHPEAERPEEADGNSAAPQATADPPAAMPPAKSAPKQPSPETPKAPAAKSPATSKPAAKDGKPWEEWM